MKTFFLASTLLLVPAAAFAGGAHPPTPALAAPGGPVTQTVRQDFSQTVRNDITNRNNNTNRNVNNNTNRARANSDALAYNEGNRLSNSYNYREYRQAPGIAASFSGGPTAPCERNPLGIGGSSAVPNPFGFLFQIPLTSGPCWQERQLQNGLVLRSQGIRISDNALLAIWAGNDVMTAVQNNPYVGRAYAPIHRVQRTHRKRVVGCGC